MNKDDFGLSKALAAFAMALALAFLLVCVSGCSTLGYKLVEDQSLGESYKIQTSDLDMSLGPAADSAGIDAVTSPDAKVEIRDTKTGKAWTITRFELAVMTAGYGNWRAVAESKPKITSITQDAGHVYVIFNYFDKGKKSVLSWRMTINKSFIYRNTTAGKLANGVMWGALAYSVLATILLIVLL